jgi:capsular exopolysaccharide synthesis family protein
LVTSAAPGEGKSTVASNLAAGLAQAGKKVVLMSCDFRRPTTDQFFGVNNMIGLSEVLLGANSLKSALQRPGDEQLLVLTSGKMPPNPSELLGSQKMADLIENLKEWADWIVIDSPPPRRSLAGWIVC